LTPFSVRDGVVLPQEVAPEIAAIVAPDRVDVVAAVLRGIEFDQEFRALHAVIVRPPALDGARPREADRLEAIGCARQARLAQRRLEARRVRFHEAVQLRLLCVVE
jgi:hypothetical protein